MKKRFSILFKAPIITLFLFSYFFTCFNFSFAQSPANNPAVYNLLEPLNSEDGAITGIIIKEGGLGDYLEQIMSYLLILITVCAVFYMVYGGALYLTTDIISKKEEGREVVNRVVIGLVFVFSVWTIMNSINSGLLKDSLDFSLSKLGVFIKNVGTGNTTVNTSTPSAPTVKTPPASCPEGLEIIQGSYQLCKSVSSNMKSLIAAAAADGVTLTVVSAYRPNDSATYSAGTVAASGKSMHQIGLAVDFSGFKRGPASDKRYVWLRSNAGKFGFSNNLAPGRSDEYNHWSTNGR